MPNPVLNAKTFAPAGTDGRPGAWAPPNPATAGGAAPPISDGPVSPYTSYRERVMTLDGTVVATGVLFAILLVGGAIGWALTPTRADGTVQFPAWLFLPLLGALGAAFWCAFRPAKAKLISPIYAILEGMVLGAISKAYEAQWDGIVVQAIGMTIAVFLVMLVTFRFRIIKVTEKTRSVIIGATIGVMLFYGVSLLLSLFGNMPSFINSPSGWGILFSILVAGIAALNLLLDFDLIEKGTKMGAPKYMEWYAGFGLMVTLVWLYLEILRLLGKLRSN